MLTLMRMSASVALCIVTLTSSCRKKNAAFNVDEPIVSSSHILLADTSTFNNSIKGYYVALPHNYDSARTRYPLLVFLHGLGQRGNGKDQLPYLLFDGIGKVIKDNRLPESFTVLGQKFSMVIASPQYSIQPDEDDVMQFVDSLISRYRIKTNRVYISGLSLGARIATLTAAKYPNRFSALVPIAGVAAGDSMQSRCNRLAEANLPAWALHNADDPMSDVNESTKFVSYINQHSPLEPSRLTIFDKYGHDAWTTALDTAYREDGRNIYEWMLQYYR